MSNPVAGKYLLEILTSGMYSNPLHVYREYIQNASDSIDEAIRTNIISEDEARIRINIDFDLRQIEIEDNGVGVHSNKARTVLLSIGASAKDGLETRGFRGIGRLAGLAYAETVVFETSSFGDKAKTILACDCNKMKKLLQRDNSEVSDVMEAFKAISTITYVDEPRESHYFMVRLEGVDEKSPLLNESIVSNYISETAPIDFDLQRFPHATKIDKQFLDWDANIPCYKVYFGKRKLEVTKPYGRSIQTKKSKRDLIRDIEFHEDYSKDGSPLYYAWIALTSFAGIIDDEKVAGIRLRKGNILIGNGNTFSKYFPEVIANRMFVGEVHVVHPSLIPNSQRDDFEQNDIYDELCVSLRNWASSLNKNYRRGIGQANNAREKLDKQLDELTELQSEIRSGSITSDKKREQYQRKTETLKKQIEASKKKVDHFKKKGFYSEESTDAVDEIIEKAAGAVNSIHDVQHEIAEQDYATKYDLSSKYSRKERKVYQEIIEVIDAFFGADPDTAKELRLAIINRLNNGAL